MGETYLVFGLPYNGNTNDLLLTGLTHWKKPQMDTLKIPLTAYYLQVTGYGFTHYLQNRIDPETSRIEDI